MHCVRALSGDILSEEMLPHQSTTSASGLGPRAVRNEGGCAKKRRRNDGAPTDGTTEDVSTIDRSSWLHEQNARARLRRPRRSVSRAGGA
mmetsp:Transcript_15404/g.61995  ORF Transcript_15404/g.61995 Transcript_15404/m.61995 type:complete len:90 (-) Transcript_15404:182-451(-)